MSRKVKDAFDKSTGEKVYFTGHASATYCSDGSTVEYTLSRKVNTSEYQTDMANLNATIGDINTALEEIING